ncbi:P-loop containing nucleoside triphosphate hydrolase protein [Filobasidium floriforme]|uniref:P-loop containing nucleoside triphosphate hydrolase protein n=1 Tax=Filobasidium floriforme TaxID=5210 RepID=UPI001E8DB270|nr:P-loop containing nucleoside triphosphate hydrolase protein [Filobasidium floriforme]KAH8084577.1 P-loop containing nucleoside triphosphate hydrolase protein [Filobasidium floriforme]
MEPQISVQSTDLALPATLPAPDSQHTTSVAESRSASSRTSAILDFASNAIESAALRDGLKLIVLGGALEAARRGCGLVAQQILEQFTIHALFVDTDISYDWLLAWLSTKSNQSSARRFQVSIHGTDPNATWANAEAGTGGDGFAFLPSPDGVRWSTFEGRLIRFVRVVDKRGLSDPRESLEVTVFAKSQEIIKRLVEQARLVHQARDQGKVVVYTPSRQSWQRSAARPPRKLESIVLPRGVKEGVVKDVIEFFQAAEWYADRGIPHRRGYLLHGVPGSGKTSLITAVAGRLGLDLFVINLAQKGLDDQTLQTLAGAVTERGLLLFEDIDCAFPSREDLLDAEENPRKKKLGKPAQAASGVTLSGLLNCMDGVLTQEGCVLFATTNHVEALDPALKRPGRMDVWIEFKNATKEQAEDLFLHFYPSTEETRTEIRDWAHRYSQGIPENKYPVAALQGHLMQHKGLPKRAVESLDEWLSTNGGRVTAV